MLLQCHNCSSKFRVSAQAIGDGREVRCATCKNEWFAYAHDLIDETLPETFSSEEQKNNEEKNIAEEVHEEVHDFVSAFSASVDDEIEDDFGSESLLAASNLEDDTTDKSDIVLEENISDDKSTEVEIIAEQNKFSEEDLALSDESLSTENLLVETLPEDISALEETKDKKEEDFATSILETIDSDITLKKNNEDNFAPIPGLAPVFVPVLTVNNQDNKGSNYDFGNSDNLQDSPNISFAAERALPTEGSASARRRYWPFCAALAASFLLFVGTSLFTWADDLRKEIPALSGFYDSLGIHDSNGIKLANIKMTNTPLGSKNRYNISGAVINTTGDMRKIPNLSIIMINKNGKVLQSWPFPPRVGSIAPGEKLEFDTGKIDSHFVNSEYAFLIDVGNRLELWRRKP